MEITKLVDHINKFSKELIENNNHFIDNLKYVSVYLVCMVMYVIKDKCEKFKGLINNISISKLEGKQSLEDVIFCICFITFSFSCFIPKCDLGLFFISFISLSKLNDFYENFSDQINFLKDKNVKIVLAVIGVLLIYFVLKFFNKMITYIIWIVANIVLVTGCVILCYNWITKESHGDILKILLYILLFLGLFIVVEKFFKILVQSFAYIANAIMCIYVLDFICFKCLKINFFCMVYNVYLKEGVKSIFEDLLSKDESKDETVIENVGLIEKLEEFCKDETRFNYLMYVYLHIFICYVIYNLIDSIFFKGCSGQKEKEVHHYHMNYSNQERK
ncbi:hypothetical protein A0H76_2616 [Hepatospora eriocheir]|uniref:Uncharacterized protein n=1 Tax=Hepatospora eriocheir TaxID=1081669 RepID=A0A1X0QF07_9MICR|nr:hypothetical protein A0H76_2616 [Hepatospora eriocheir]